MVAAARPTPEVERRVELLLEIDQRAIEKTDVAGGSREVAEALGQEGDDRRGDHEVGDAETEQSERLPDAVAEPVGLEAAMTPIATPTIEPISVESIASSIVTGSALPISRHRAAAGHRDPEVAGEDAAQPREELDR